MNKYGALGNKDVLLNAQRILFKHMSDKVFMADLMSYDHYVSERDEDIQNLYEEECKRRFNKTYDEVFDEANAEFSCVGAAEEYKRDNLDSAAVEEEFFGGM